MRRNRPSGLAAPELLVAAVIVVLLAFIAAPAAVRWVHRAKTAEAYDGIDRIAQGAKAYYLGMSLTAGDGVFLRRQFPQCPGCIADTTAPTTECCAQPGQRCAGTNWDGHVWVALHFATDNHYYQFSFLSANTDASATFTARAVGDLDCDGIHATFERRGHAVGTRAVEIGPVVVDPQLETE